MPFFAVDDQAAFHPKFVAAGNAAIGLWTRAGSWSKANATGGKIPREISRAMGSSREVSTLVRVGLWEVLEGYGHQFHDWDHITGNFSDDQEKSRREKDRDRKRKQREREKQSRDKSRDVTPDVQRPSEHSHPQSQSHPHDGLDMTHEPEVRPEVDARVRTDQVFDDVVQARAARAGAKDMRRLHGLLERAVRPIGPLSPMAAVLLVEAITNRARGEVQDVDAYVVTVARNPVDIQSLYQSEDLEFMSRQDDTDRSIA